MVVAFAVISLVGIPGQEVPAAITFWLAAFWYVFLIDAPRARESMTSRQEWTALLVVVGLFAAGTMWMATTSLRVPARAQRFGWPYSYGFYRPETGTFGPGPGWAGGRAVWVFEAPLNGIALTVSADYRGLLGSGFTGASGQALTRPSDVRLWCNGSPLLDTRLTTTAPITTQVRAPAGGRWMFVETSVSRPVPLRDLGIDVDGEVGVRIDWTPVHTAAAVRTPGSTCGRP
jgi:hypothetical protein